MPGIVEEYGLDVFATDRALKAAKEKAIKAKERAEAKHAGPVENGRQGGHKTKVTREKRQQPAPARETVRKPALALAR